MSFCAASPSESHEKALSRLKHHRNVWAKRPVLRQVYRNYYERVCRSLPEPCIRILELGGGTGNFKEFFPDVISTEIIFCRWVDAVMDAHFLSIKDGVLDAVVMIDVLHHLEAPMVCLREVERTLRKKGRLLLIDMYISPLSYLVLKLFHREPVDLKEDFWHNKLLLGRAKDPWKANQAMVTKLFWREKARFEALFPGLRILHREAFDWCWPLSGGFSHRSLWPVQLKDSLKTMSRWRLMNRLGAFCSFVVMEKD